MMRKPWNWFYVQQPLIGFETLWLKLVAIKAPSNFSEMVNHHFKESKADFWTPRQKAVPFRWQNVIFLFISREIDKKKTTKVFE